MGNQALYHVIISVEVNGHGDSDQWTHQFGFRKIENYIDTETGGRYNWKYFQTLYFLDKFEYHLPNNNVSIDCSRLMDNRFSFEVATGFYQTVFFAFQKTDIKPISSSTKI